MKDNLMWCLRMLSKRVKDLAKEDAPGKLKNVEVDSEDAPELTLGSSPLSYLSCVLSLTHPRSTCRRHRQHPLSSLCRSTFVPSATTRLDKMRCQSIYSRRKGEDRYEGRLFACDRLPEVAERAR
jgi:hypothetical protein